MIETIATFNNTRLPNGTYNVGFDNIETKNNSESGKTLRIVTRLKKRVITAQYKTSSHELEVIEAICERGEGSLEFCGKTYRVAPRLNSSDLLEGSQNVENTEGLWTTTVKFEEV